MQWKPREIKDIDKGRKFPEKRECPKHGIYYSEFCLKCQMEKLGVRPNMES